MRSIRRHSIVLGAAAAALVLAASSAPAQKITTERVFTGLSAPTYLTHAGDGSGRLFILEQNTARIRVVDGTLQATPFLDINPVASSGGERGLLGLAFHPDYATNGLFYVNYTNNSGNTVIAEYQASPPSSNTANAGSARILRTIPQPFSNHNGGWIGFGPNDGYLYIGMGDGGSAGDPGNRSQDPQNLLGKMLRIDVDTDDFPGDPNINHGIPPSNPFVGDPTTFDAIWDLGLRNPWRCSFDRANADLYIGDVGQNAIEEIDYEPAGTGGAVNWGWRLKEGTQCFNPSNNCDPGGITTDPIHEFGHAGGNCSVTGGYVYRGTDIPGLQGTYFFADWCSNQLWSFRVVGGVKTEFKTRTAELAPNAGVINSVTSFGEDEQGEIYIVDGGGEIFKIISDQMVLGVPQMVGGQPVNMSVSKATPGRKVFYIYSLVGTGVNPEPRLNTTLYLLNPLLIGTTNANGSGNAVLPVNIPASASGRTVWLQAAEKANTSNVVMQTIL